MEFGRIGALMSEERRTSPSGLRGLFVQRRVLSIADQGLVSLGNFLAFIIYARYLSPEAWGAFGFAHVAAMFVQGFQRAAVTIPLVTYSSLSWKADRSHWVAQNNLAVVAALGCMGLVALAAYLAGPGWLARSLAAAALLIGPMFLFEFCRRSAIQEQAFWMLPMMSGAYAVIGVAVAALAVLEVAGSEWLPAIGMSLACAAAVVVYLAGSRKPIVHRPRAWTPAADYRQFVSWSAAGHLAFSGYFFGVQSVLAALAGPRALGVYFACRILIQPVNTLINAMDSVDKPRAASALQATGNSAMRGVLLRSGMAMLVAALPYLVVLVLFASTLAHWVLGPQYASEKATVWAWAAVALLMVLLQPVESGLYVLRRGRALFVNRVCASVVGLASAAMLVPLWGPTGATAAMALALSAALLLGCVTLFGRSGSSKPGIEGRP